jgi:hypothetical protein
MTDEEEDRRKFLATCGRFAAVTPPALTVLLSTSLTSNAVAGSMGHGGYGKGGNDYGNYGNYHSKGKGKGGKGEDSQGENHHHDHHNNDDKNNNPGWIGRGSRDD